MESSNLSILSANPSSRKRKRERERGRLIFFSRKILNETKFSSMCVCVYERDNWKLNWNVIRWQVAKLHSEWREWFQGVELRRFRIVGRPSCSRSAVVNRNRTFMIYPFDRFGLGSACVLMQIEILGLVFEFPLSFVQVQQSFRVLHQIIKEPLGNTARWSIFLLSSFILKRSLRLFKFFTKLKLISNSITVISIGTKSRYKLLSILCITFRINIPLLLTLFLRGSINCQSDWIRKLHGSSIFQRCGEKKLLELIS